MKHRAIAVLVAMGLLTGCTLGPNYQRPRGGGASIVPCTGSAADC